MIRMIGNRMTSRPRGAPRSSASPLVGLAAAAALASALSGCGVAKDVMGLNYDQLPEGENVETAAWPRLADAPAPVPPVQLLKPNEELPERSLGGAVEADVAAEADALRALASELTAEPVVREDLRRQAAAVRRRNAELDAHDRRAAEALQAEEASARVAAEDEAARIRAEIEAELRAVRGGAAAAE